MIYFRIYFFLILINLSFETFKSSLLNDFSSYTIENFKTELENEDYLFVYFFSYDCNICKKTNEFYKKAIKVFIDDKKQKEKDINEQIGKIKFAQINCNHEIGFNICKSFLVNSFPKFKLFRFGNYLVDFIYNENNDLFKWLKKYANPISIRFSSFIALNKFLKSAKEPVVLGLFVNNYDKHSVNLWYNAISKVKSHWNYKEIIFCHIFENYSKDRLIKFSILNTSKNNKLNLPTVIIYKPIWMENIKERRAIFYDFSSKEDLEKWIKRKAFGFVIWRTRDNADEIKLPLLVAYYDVNFKKNNKFSHKWRNIVLNLAFKKPNINFAISKAHTFRKYLRNLNLSVPYDEEDPVFIAYDIFGVNYLFNESYSESSLFKFVSDFEEGFLKPLVNVEKKSLLNLNNDKSNVIEIIDLEFPKKVTFNKKDVFIMFYAPWCKYCKNLLPIWDEISNLLKNESNLDILKIDATQNEIPIKFEIKIYPTFYFIPFKSKEIIIYKQGTMLHNFIQFIVKHVSHPLKTYDKNGLFIGLDKTNLTKDEL